MTKLQLLGLHFQNTFTPNSTTNIHFYNLSNFLSLPILMFPKILISPSEIHSIIKTLKTRKSPGLDTINNQTLKSLGKRSIAAFTSILNSRRFNYFPTIWKTAIVLPFVNHKKILENPSNYRPISLLSSLSKIFETLIHHRLLHFTTINKIIPPTQLGFTHQQATTHQLLRLTEHIENSFT